MSEKHFNLEISQLPSLVLVLHSSEADAQKEKEAFTMAVSVWVYLVK